MARSFLSMDGVGPSVDVVDDALLVMYALTVQRLSDLGESCATLHELLVMGESWPGMLGLEMSSLDRACVERFCGVVQDLARGHVSADELQRVRERWLSHVREWKDEIPKELIEAAAARVVEELEWG